MAKQEQRLGLIALIQRGWANTECAEMAEDLLKACKALLAAQSPQLGHDEYVRRFGFSQEHATENALTAIAKAEGK